MFSSHTCAVFIGRSELTIQLVDCILLIIRLLNEPYELYLTGKSPFMRVVSHAKNQPITVSDVSDSSQSNRDAKKLSRPVRVESFQSI